MLKNQLHCEKLWLLIFTKKEKICKVDISTQKTQKTQNINYGSSRTHFAGQQKSLCNFSN